MIYTAEDIERKVSEVSGTWVKRRNARKRLAEESNGEVYKKIADAKNKIRRLKVAGVKDGALRGHYAEVTRLELMVLW